jgi:hypothetical protein
MPKNGKTEKPQYQQELEYQKATFPKKLRVVERKAERTLQMSRKRSERAPAERALKAAGRVRKRLGAPRKKADIPRQGQKDLAGGLKALYQLGKGLTTLPGREAAALEGVKKKTER